MCFVYVLVYVHVLICDSPGSTWVPEEMAQAASVRRPLPVIQWAILAKPLGPGYKLHVAIIPLVKKGPGTRGKGKRICIGASNGEVTT